MTLPLSSRVKGVLKAKGVRGNIVEYAPSEKIPIAVKYALALHLKEKGFSPAVVGNPVVDDFTSSKKGDLLKKKYQNNNYTARGSITYFLREIATDKAFEKQTSVFDLKFEDELDQNGTPSMKIVKFELT
jgi:hypothetical protein